MKRPLATGVIGALIVAATSSSVPCDRYQWKQLFNGKDLSGWQHVGDGGMTVENGLIRTYGPKGMGLLWWTGGKIGNAVIRVVYKTKDKADNSGVFIRIPIEPREAWMPVHYGYEVNIEYDPARWKEDDYYATGSLYSFTRIFSKADRPGPEWNTLEITLEGARTIVFVNGVKVTDYKEGDPVPRRHDGDPLRGPRPNEGFIGIQNEGDESVFFKEIAVRPLP
jgi:3-keto-disaccharide hydrolase